MAGRGIAAVLAAAAVAVSAVIWLPRAFDQNAGPTGAAGAALVGRSSGPAGRARFTYRVVTAGVPEAHGTEDVTFSGNNRSLSFSDYSAARGPQPAQVYSGTERLVDGQVYIPVRVRGRLRWVHEPSQVYVTPRIIDPRRLLRVLAPYARFQASGYQVIGGVRLKVLRATDPGNLTRRALLPVLYTSGLSVGRWRWVDGQGWHRMAFTFISYAKIASKPVSTAALRTISTPAAEGRTMARPPLLCADRQADPRAPATPRPAAGRPSAAARLPRTAGKPGDHDHGDVLRHRPAAAHHRPPERDVLSPVRPADDLPPECRAPCRPARLGHAPRWALARRTDGMDAALVLIYRQPSHIPVPCEGRRVGVRSEDVVAGWGSSGTVLRCAGIEPRRYW